MNSKLVSVLASVCTVCALIISGEWFYARQAQKHILTSTISGETKISSDEMPDIELTRQSEESYADLVARPLFIKGRRPIDEPSPEEAQAINVANTFDWQLNGIYSMKKGLSVLFSRSKSRVPKDNYRKIIEGADLDGWKLTEIHKDRVILKQGSQQKELLLRKPKLKELPKKLNIPNIPSPHPGVSPQPEDSFRALGENAGRMPQPGVSPQPQDSFRALGENAGQMPQPEDSPQPEISPQPEDSPQPPEGDFENNDNENF